MALYIEPDLGVPYKASTPYMDLRDRAQAACNTAMELSRHGLDVEPTREDEEVAATLLGNYASDPETTSRAVSNDRMGDLTPATLVYAGSILDEYGRSVVTSALQIRHLVTNKLLIETENDDAKVRLKALELLGKISDVGLFSEKSHITVEHQSPDELRRKLRRKLETLVNKGQMDNTMASEVDRELGLDDPVTIDGSAEYDD